VRVHPNILLVFSLAAGVSLPSTPEAASPRPKAKDLVVLRSERWVDTIRGTLKSLAAAPAEEVVVVVKFRDRKKTLLGTETVKVGPLQPGEERDFQVPMPDKVRKATTWEITPMARWGAAKR
jgi:hypothetical protein